MILRLQGRYMLLLRRRQSRESLDEGTTRETEEADNEGGHGGGT